MRIIQVHTQCMFPHGKQSRKILSKCLFQKSAIKPILPTDYFVWFFRAEYGIKLQYTYIYLEPLVWGIISATSLTRTVLKSLFAFGPLVAFIFQIYLSLWYAKGVPIQVNVPLLYDLRRILFKAFPFLALQCLKFLLLGSCLLRSL